MKTDGRSKNGGARSGAGRKSATDEADLRRRLAKASKEGKKDRLDNLFDLLFKDCFADSFRIRHASRNLFLAYRYGKPTQRVILEEEKPDTGAGRFDLSQLKQEELEILERAGEILAKARGGQGGEGQA
jgi:hypothetical protein